MIHLMKMRLMVFIVILTLPILLAAAYLKPFNLQYTAQASFEVDSRGFSLPEVASPARDSSNLFDTPEKLEMLIRDSDIIVRGRVISQVSHWNSDKTDVETDTLIEPLYRITGDTPNPFTIRSNGGILEDEGFAIHDSEAPTFEVGQEVLLFAYEEDSHYRVAHGQRGKFLIGKSVAVSEVQRTNIALHMLYAEIKFHLLNLDKPILLPYGWEDMEPNTEEIIIGQGYLYNERRWETKDVRYKVNINTNQASRPSDNGSNSNNDGSDNGSVEDFLNAIIAAGDTWTSVNRSDFRLIYDGLTSKAETGINGSNDIVFENRGKDAAVAKARYWFNPKTGIIQEADIWLNDAFEWSATGKPEENELDLQTAVLHEMGHWLALGHDTAESSVMYFSLPGGITKRILNDNDRGGIAFIYPCLQDVCTAGRLDSETTSTPTLRPQSTQRPIATSTALSTSTPKPTSNQELIPTSTPSQNVVPSSTVISHPTPTPAKTVEPVKLKLTPLVEPGGSIEPTKTVGPTETAEPDNPRARPSYAEEIQAGNGGSLLGLVEQLSVDITVPPEAAKEDITLLLEYVESDDIDNDIDVDMKIFGPAFSINANDRNGTPITQFDPPLELVLTYSDLLTEEEKEMMLDRSIHLNYWHTERERWVTVLSQIDRDKLQITAKLDHLTIFAILVGDPYRTYLPIVLE